MDRTLDHAAVVAEFLALYLTDRDAGRMRTLADYRCHFPGFEDLVGEEWEALARERDTERPSMLGPYVLEDVLGSGAQAIVHRARDTRSGGIVALKVLRARTSPADRERFLREAQATRKVDHPGVCAVLDAGCADGHSYLAMPRIEGPTLRSWLAEHEGPTPVRTTVSWFERFALAVHAAHERGLIHRDLKPSNLALHRGTEPIVLDFGLVKDLDDEAASATATMDVLGTPAYLAPERLETPPRAASVRSDVYALGVSLYEALAGRRPFVGTTREALIQAIRCGDCVSLRKVRPDVPRNLQLVVERAMAREPRHRYDSAHALARDLARVLTGDPVQARPISRIVRSTRWAKSHPVASISFAVISACAIALAAMNREARHARDEAFLARAGMQDALAHSGFLRGELETHARDLETELDRSHGLLLAAQAREALERNAEHALDLAMQAHEELGDDPIALGTLYAALDGLQERATIAHVESPGSWLVTSPNGRWIATQRGQGVHLVGLEGETISRRDIELSIDDSSFARFSPSGRTLAVCVVDAETSRVVTIDTRTATVRHELTTLRGDVGSLAFDADERLLAVAGGTSAGPGIPADAGVRVFDLATGERRHALSGHRAPVVAIAFPHDGATLVTAALDGTIHTWDLASGERRATTNVPSLRDLEPFQTVCEGIVHITPDGKIATVLRNDALERWDLGSGERLPMDAPRKGHQVLSHVLSKDARFALACSTQRSRDRGTATHGASPLNAWNLATGRWEGSFGDFTQRVLATTFVDSGSDGEREVFALFADGRTSRWDFASGRELASFAGFGVPVRDACFTSDGNSVTMLLDDGRVQRLATRGGSHVPNMHVPGVRDPSIAGATGDIALIVHRGGYARWDLASWNAVAFTPADGGNGVAALSMDGKRTAVVTAHGVEFIDGEGLHAGSGFETKENALALMFAGEGAMLAGCWRAGHVRVFDEHGMLAWQARVRGVPVRALPSVDGTRVLVSTLRGQVFVIERDAPDTPKLLEEVSGYALALTPDGRYAVTSGSYAEHGEDTSTWNEPARLIDLERGEVVATIDLPSGALHAAASRDGQRIAVVGWDKIVRVWDRSRESVVATFGVLPEAITQLVITPDGRFVAVTGWDQVVRILDVQTSALRHRLDLPENSHPRLLFDRTGRWLLIATFRGEVRAIPMDPATFARTIRRPDAPMPSVDSQKKR